MTEYLDMEGKKLKKGFYFYLPKNIYDDEEIKTPESIYYFTGKFTKEKDPIFKTFDLSGDNIRILSRSSCRYLRLRSKDQIEKKIEGLEKELDWYKENL